MGWTRRRRHGPIAGWNPRLTGHSPGDGEQRLLLVIGYFVMLAMLGGGQVGWTPAYIVIMLATLVVVPLGLWRGGLASLRALPPLARWSLVGVAVLPLLQIAPLPPSLWHALPGQGLRRQVLTLVGLDATWQPLSLEPVTTALSALMAIGFVGLTAMILHLTDIQFRRLLVAAQGVVLLGVAIGFLQVANDGQFPNLQGVKTGGVLLGFYANKNHMAVVLAITIPLFSFLVGPDLFGSRRALPIGLGYTALTLSCIVATNSRAGLLLGLIAAIIAFRDVVAKAPLRYSLAAVFVVGGLSWLVGASSAFEAVSSRFKDVDDDLRWRFLSWSWPLAKRYGLFGSGAGSFASLFITQEKLAWVKPTIVNHTHDEYLQIVIEFGVAGVALLLSLAAALLRPFARWRALPLRDPRRVEMLFGFSVIILFVLHSFIDYPLRRPAAWVFLALALGAVYRPGDAVGRGRGQPLGPAGDTGLIG